MCTLQCWGGGGEKGERGWGDVVGENVENKLVLISFTYLKPIGSLN